MTYTKPTRKNSLVVLLVLLGKTCFAQGSAGSPDVYRLLPGVTNLTSNSTRDKIGSYRLGGGLSFLLLKLDSNGLFKITEYECVGSKIFDSGKWTVYPTGRLKLESTKGVKTFDLIKYSHFYFCISPEQRMAFVNDFKKRQAEFNDPTPAQVRSTTYTTDELIAGRLMDDHYTRDLEK